MKDSPWHPVGVVVAVHACEAEQGGWADSAFPVAVAARVAALVGGGKHGLRRRRHASSMVPVRLLRGSLEVTIW